MPENVQVESPASADPGVHVVAGGHAQSDDINVSLIAIIGAFSAVGLFLVVVLLQAWFFSFTADEQARKLIPANDPGTAYGQMIVEQQGQLNSYHWVKQDAKIRAIPITQAMEIVASELAANQKGKLPEATHDGTQ
jgi:hypothetical protein